MAFNVKGKNGKTYYLYQSKKFPNIRYFSLNKKLATGKAIDLPKEYKVVQNMKTGLPVLKRKK